MKLAELTLALCLGLLAFSPAQADESHQECEALFAHSAQEIAFDGTSLTMTGASPSVVFFCDRPVRFAGHLTVQSFLDTVSGSDDPFRTNPPNAAVSIVRQDGSVSDIVVTITGRPTVDGDTITYASLTVLEGDAAPAVGAGTIFIDHFGRPMSPGSVAGVHRRHDRREVRRCEAGNDAARRGIDCACGPGLVCY